MLKIFAALAAEDLKMLPMLCAPPELVYQARMEIAADAAVYYSKDAIQILAARLAAYEQIKTYFRLLDFGRRKIFRYAALSVDSVLIFPVERALAVPADTAEMYELYIFTTNKSLNKQYVFEAGDAICYRRKWYGLRLSSVSDAKDYPALLEERMNRRRPGVGTAPPR